MVAGAQGHRFTLCPCVRKQGGVNVGAQLTVSILFSPELQLMEGCGPQDKAFLLN